MRSEEVDVVSKKLLDNKKGLEGQPTSNSLGLVVQWSCLKCFASQVLFHCVEARKGPAFGLVPSSIMNLSLLVLYRSKVNLAYICNISFK